MGGLGGSIAVVRCKGPRKVAVLGFALHLVQSLCGRTEGGAGYSELAKPADTSEGGSEWQPAFVLQSAMDKTGAMR